MADPFGISFSPTDQTGPNGVPQNGQRPSPIQQAIQTLSLRIPRTNLASPIAPLPLLTSQGGGALGGDPNAAALLEQLRRQLFGTPSQAQSFNAPSLPSMPQSNPLDALAGLFGQTPSAPPTSGSGAPDGGSGAPLPDGGDSGTGAPLPGGSAPLPSFDFKNFVPRVPNPAPMPEPVDRPDRGGRGAV